MKNDNLNLIKQIELINEHIFDECQEYLYYTPRGNSNIFEKITNASNTLVNNAMRLLRNQKPLLYDENATPLTIEQTKNMMFKMYQIMITSEIPIKKETMLRKMIREDFSFNPEKILQTKPSIEREEYKIAMLLNNSF